MIQVDAAPRVQPARKAERIGVGVVSAPIHHRGSIARVELIPKALVVGVFAAVQPSTTPPVTPEKLNRIWAEVAPQHGYRQLQLAPDGSAAQFFGATGDDGATIQLPLIQVRSGAMLGAANAAESAQDVLRSIATHLGISQFFNLGIKHVYHAAVADNDARGFVMRKLLRRGEDDLGDLTRGGSLWTGMKYGLEGVDGSQYTLVIEPWLADNRYVFVDLDAQYPGAVTLDAVKERSREAEQFVTGAVKAHLDAAEAQ
jgi:hypothetical protein